MSLAPETLKHNSLCIHHILMTNRTKLKAFKNQLFLNCFCQREAAGGLREDTAEEWNTAVTSVGRRLRGQSQLPE